MIDLVGKDFRTVKYIVSILKVLKEKVDMRRSEMEDIRKNQVGHLEMKSKISEIKISFSGINSGLTVG